MAEEFGAFVKMDVIRVSSEKIEHDVEDIIASEVPLTILADEEEIATLLVSPCHIQELVCGYLYTSGFVNDISEIKNFYLDKQKWTAYVNLPDKVDPSFMRKRLYTASCGKCAMYTNVNEMSMRQKMENDFRIDKKQIYKFADMLENGSELFNKTGAVHTSILSCKDGDIIIDDIARHNAVDKVIGRALLEKIDLKSSVLARTGRTSSEIIYKVKRCGIPVTVARGAPTHQAVHLCREMGITLAGFARKKSFNIYSCPERIIVD